MMAIFKKAKNFFTETAGRAMNKSTMIATTKGMAEMIYADGVVEEKEMIAAWAVFRRNPKLAVFGGEAERELNYSLDAWEKSKRQARTDTTRAIESWLKTASHEDREDFMNSVLDLMDSDDTQHDAEMEVAKKYAEMLGLKIENYL